MKRPNPTYLLPASMTAAAVMLLMQPLQAEVLEKTKQVGDTAVHYKVVLPDGYDPAKAYPAILGFGGGPQDMKTVDGISAATSAPRRKSAAISWWRRRHRTTSCSSRRATGSSRTS